MTTTFPKKEKLKSNTEISSLFSEGNTIAKYPIRLLFKKAEHQTHVTIKTAVSVSKRNFKNATDRNHIKRLLRESYRKQKIHIPDTLTNQYSFLFLYTAKTIPRYEEIETKIKKIIDQFVQQEC